MGDATKRIHSHTLIDFKENILMISTKIKNMGVSKNEKNHGIDQFDLYVIWL